MCRSVATVILAAGVLIASAEPLVVGFHRFHSSEETIEGGRLLFNELGCVNCHDRTTELPKRAGPDVRGITRRVNASWLREFLLKPDSHRSGSTMPHMFRADEATGIENVLHYLASLESPNAQPFRASRHSDAGRGKRLYQKLGCVACHESEVYSREPIHTKYPSVAFPDFRKKYSLVSLTEFLKDPLRTQSSGRMPRFDLDPQSASDIAAYLLDFRGSNPEVAPSAESFEINPMKIQRGLEVVKEKRCASCHELPKEAHATPVQLRSNHGGCLDGAVSGKHPTYRLTESQRESLLLFLTTNTTATNLATTLNLTLEALNCIACHDRNGNGGPGLIRREFFSGDEGLGDAGKLPPPLTGAGHKLNPEWLRGLFDGNNRVRPYLHTQMPVYGESTDGLAKLFAEVDQQTSAVLPEGDPDAGWMLLGIEGGNSCITCHAWGERRSLGIPGMNISNMADRLNPSWVHDYLIDPAAYRPNTLMPTFWPGGIAANTEILGGDTSNQIASIIAFAQQGSGLPPGFPDVESNEYELAPNDRPIVLRTFMKNVGTHAIVVGFPEGIHLAYDGLNARPALAWKGRFFNAYNTWFSRFAPFEEPLGHSVVKWQESEARQRTFLGYQIDEQGVPTFIWREDNLEVREKFEVSGGQLQRTLWTSNRDEAVPEIEHPDKVQISPVPSNNASTLRVNYTWK